MGDGVNATTMAYHSIWIFALPMVIVGYQFKDAPTVRREEIFNIQGSGLWRLGMRTSEIRPGEQVKDVHFTEDSLSVDFLMDGRTIIVPLAWYPRLLHASVEQRRNWQVCSGGFGIHWPDIDEDLCTEGLLRGAPAPRLDVTSYLDKERSSWNG